MNKARPASARSFADRLADWWLHDLPPMNGPLRLFFYLGLFLMGWFPVTRAPAFLHTPELMAAMNSSYFTPQGLIRVLDLYPSHQIFCLVRAVTVVAWLAAALGLFGRLSSVTVALGALFLHGFWFSATGQGHAWYLGIYAMLALCFSTTDDNWTLDTLIARRFPGYWFKPAPDRGQLSRTGFARKLVVACGVAILFSGGVAKLLDTGFIWLDGCSLQSYVAYSMQNLVPPKWPWLAQFMLDHRWFSSLLSIFTFILELGSLVALFSRPLRHLVFLAACGFHLGIYLVMMPAFFIQMFTYVLVMDWGSLLGRAPAKRRGEPPAWSRQAASVGALALCAILTLVNVTRVEFWPTSHVPMYSTYYTHDRIGQYAAHRFLEPAGVREVSQHCQTAYCSWWYSCEIFFHAGLQVANGATVTPVRYQEVAGPWVIPPQWKSILAPALMADFAQSAPGVPYEGRVQPILRTMAESMKTHWCLEHACTGAQLQVTYTMAGEKIIVASTPL